MQREKETIAEMNMNEAGAPGDRVKFKSQTQK